MKIKCDTMNATIVNRKKEERLTHSYTAATLNRYARKIHKHGHVRVGKAHNQAHGGSGFYIGASLKMETKTKNEMFYYLLGLSHDIGIL